MKLERIPHNPGELLEFYEEGLARLGALCERTWHDRLEIVAEGPPARLWNPEGALHEIELQFAPADAASARDASREVFPGCPLTFRLADALRPSPLLLERFVLPEGGPARASDASVMEKLWRAQFPDTTRWQLVAAPRPDFHFALLALARCEIQAMDQHWSLHRLAVSLADQQLDDTLARDIGFHQTAGGNADGIAWPAVDPAQWQAPLHRALEQELEAELEVVRARQENSLRRELERIDDYFESYQGELTARSKRSSTDNARIRIADRLAAARAEHARRRADQLARHEIRIQPHVDALLLLAETAWRASLHVERSRQTQRIEALFVPRSRDWRICGQ